jgi:3-dehydroquinate synthase
MSHSTEVQLSNKKSYAIRGGENLWDELVDFFAAHYSDRKLFILIDARVHKLHGRTIEKQATRYFKTCHTITIPEGESSKSVQQWTRLQDELLAKGIERSTPVLAVGGGVSGDLAGFTAASVLRGVPLIHLPTSLLAMVDSSIGGKTAINHATGKNLIGAFYQPDAVFTDIDFLKTLERKEWIGGLAEMLKYAAIQSPPMFDELKAAVNEGFEPSHQWLKLINKSAAIKADIVQDDVHEAGKRAWLNFGHTFGHALEKLMGYGNISHGEAVFIGMMAAIHYSNACGATIKKVRFAPFRPLYSASLHQELPIPDLIDAMRYDKKVKNEKIRLVLLKDWGQPYIESSADKEKLAAAWQAAFDELNS